MEISRWQSVADATPPDLEQFSLCTPAGCRTSPANPHFSLLPLETAESVFGEAVVCYPSLAGWASAITQHCHFSLSS